MLDVSRDRGRKPAPEVSRRSAGAEPVAEPGNAEAAAPAASPASAPGPEHRHEAAAAMAVRSAVAGGVGDAAGAEVAAAVCPIPSSFRPGPKPLAATAEPEEGDEPEPDVDEGAAHARSPPSAPRNPTISWCCPASLWQNIHPRRRDEAAPEPERRNRSPRRAPAVESALPEEHPLAGFGSVASWVIPAGAEKKTSRLRPTFRL